jgi:hypothetical protein
MSKASKETVFLNLIEINACYISILVSFVTILDAVCILFTIIIKQSVQYNYCFVCSKENTFNNFIFSKPNKVHNEQCLTSAHSSMIYMYNSGKIQLTIEKFKRISGNQMSTSSSSLAAFLAWTPFDALRQCLSCLT